MADADQTYAFGNSRVIQRERLRALETLLDPGTIRHLESLGVGRGWRCLEVGAGGGSIAAWLCERTGPDGAVVATDLDTTLLNELSGPNLEIRVHDAQEDDIADAEFDLVHLRLLLAWLRDPPAVARRVVAALKPGGWLLAEEMDFASIAPDPRLEPDTSEIFGRVVQAHNAALAEHHGFDATYGRRIAGDLSDAGLEEVGHEGRASVWRGGEVGGRAWQLTLAQLRERMVATGLVTREDVDGAMELCADPRFSFLSQITVAAWGRRAPAA